MYRFAGAGGIASGGWRSFTAFEQNPADRDTIAGFARSPQSDIQ